MVFLLSLHLGLVFVLATWHKLIGWGSAVLRTVSSLLYERIKRLCDGLKQEKNHFFTPHVIINYIPRMFLASQGFDCGRSLQFPPHSIQPTSHNRPPWFFFFSYLNLKFRITVCHFLLEWTCLSVWRCFSSGLMETRGRMCPDSNSLSSCNVQEAAESSIQSHRLKKPRVWSNLCALMEHQSWSEEQTF